MRRRLAVAGLLGLLLASVAAVLAASGSDGDSARATVERPPARPRVALQVGHWQHDGLPRELRWVATSAGGASFAGIVEWEVNLAIARETQRLLESQGVSVDVIPSTVRPRYRAAAFVSIHADGNADRTVAGFKVAPSAMDESGLSVSLNNSLASHYAQTTRLSRNGSVTADMIRYYAFDSRRFTHAISPATPAVILETGFITSARDRRVIVDQPRVAATGIADGVLAFLRQRLATR